MKKGQVLGFAGFGHPGGGVVGLRFVVIQAIAGNPANINLFVFGIPIVEGKHDKILVHGPHIG